MLRKIVTVLIAISVSGCTSKSLQYKLTINQSLPIPIVYSGFSYTAWGIITEIKYYLIETGDGFYVEFFGEATQHNARELIISWVFYIDGYAIRSGLTPLPNVRNGEKFKVGQYFYFTGSYNEDSIFLLEIKNIDTDAE